MTSGGDVLEVSVDVPLRRSAAFERFTSGILEWWPKEYTWSGDALVAIAVDPVDGGFCTETGPFGFRCDFGRVLAVVPDERIEFTWQINARREPVPDPAKAGAVTARFVDQPNNHTRVTLVHSSFRRYGDGWTGYRDAMASEQGWPYLMKLFAACRAG
jgi:uncharacterized protein YndB with AHSA1/START domain